MKSVNNTLAPDLARLSDLYRTGAIDRRHLVVAAFMGHAPSAKVLGEEAPPPVKADSVAHHSLGPYTDGWTREETLRLARFFLHRFRSVWEDAWDENSRIRKDPDLFSAPPKAIQMIESGKLDRFEELKPFFTVINDHRPWDEAEILGQRYGDGVAFVAEALRDGDDPYMGTFWDIAEKKGIAELSPEISAEMLEFTFSHIREQ